MERLDARALCERYERDGFYMHTASVLPPELLARAARGIDDVREGIYDTGLPPVERRWNPGDDPQALCKIEHPQRANRALLEAISSPLLGQLAAAVTGATMVQVWWVQLLYKPGRLDRPAPGAPTSIGWHQDQASWHAWDEGSELFTAWLALSDVTPDAGPMVFVPGSHHWGLRDGGDFFAQDLDALRTAIAIPEGERWQEVADVLLAGGVSFHHRLLFHGSRQNLSAGPRRSLAIHLRTEKSSVRPDRWVAEYLDQPDICPVIFEG